MTIDQRAACEFVNSFDDKNIKWWPPTPNDVPKPSHGRVFGDKIHSVDVAKGV